VRGGLTRPTVPLLVVAAAVTGCAGTDGHGSASVVGPATSESIQVTVTPPAAMLRVGESVRLSAMVSGGPSATSRAVTFTSSDTGVVVVVAIPNEMGKVTAVGQGNATVTAASVANPQKTAAAAIRVGP
jgi:uncharacterized protein YjdB